MRIATNTTSEAVLAQLQKLSQRQSQLQTQAATGQRIFQPEDDPAAVGRLLMLEVERRRISQYQRNADSALETSQASYTSLREISKLTERATELAQLGAAPSGDDAMEAYASEVNQLIEQTLQLGNARFRNDYLFAGTAVTTEPFTATRNGSGQVTGAAYAGNTLQRSVPLSESSTIAPGTDGPTNQSIATMLDNLVALRDALSSGDPNQVLQARPALEATENQQISALAGHGAVQMRIEVNRTQQTSRTDDIERLVSAEADADLPTTLVQLSQASGAYEAALASASKILSMSLLDYLR